MNVILSNLSYLASFQLNNAEVVSESFLRIATCLYVTSVRTRIPGNIPGKITRVRLKFMIICSENLCCCPPASSYLKDIEPGEAWLLYQQVTLSVFFKRERVVFPPVVGKPE